jgi:hypothetical protein
VGAGGQGHETGKAGGGGGGGGRGQAGAGEWHAGRTGCSKPCYTIDSRLSPGDPLLRTTHVFLPIHAPLAMNQRHTSFHLLTRSPVPDMVRPCACAPPAPLKHTHTGKGLRKVRVFGFSPQALERAGVPPTLVGTTPPFVCIGEKHGQGAVEGTVAPNNMQPSAAGSS